MSKPEPVLWLNENRGIYLPQIFARFTQDLTTGIAADDWDILEEGPEHPVYWDIWDDVIRCAVVTDLNGARYFIHHDGDCWLVPEGMEWDDKTEWFVWP